MALMKSLHECLIKSLHERKSYVVPHMFIPTYRPPAYSDKQSILIILEAVLTLSTST